MTARWIAPPTAPVKSERCSRPISNNSTLKHTRLGADGQPGFGLRHFAAASNERTRIGPIGGPFVQVKGPGSAFNTETDWNGNDGRPLNLLWDTNTMRVPFTIPNGSTNYEVRYQIFGGDCIVPVAHVLTAR